MHAKEVFTQLLVTHQSKAVAHGGTFVAIKGRTQDGALYITEALQRGARTIVVSHDAVIPPEIRSSILEHNAEMLYVDDTRYALAQLSAAAYGYPARSLVLIGITGTKGKTTTSWVLHHILQASGISVALLSTVLNRIGNDTYPTELTTQQPDYMHAFFALCVARGVTHVVVEVAAQAITLHRIAGISFARIAWLNFSQEHGEFYATEQEYFTAKAALLSRITPGGMIVVPSHDKRISSIAEEQQAHIIYANPYDVLPVNTVACEPMVSCVYEGVQYTCTQLCGAYNGENVLVAVILARSLEIPPTAIAQSLMSFQGVPGRMNLYRLSNGAWGCIDYAHNPSSFEALLQELRQRTKQLLVIFGCGGERDKHKRPVMGEIATRYADYVIVTSDNPRSENVQHIIQDIRAGIPAEYMDRVQYIVDREEAIRYAYAMSTPDTIIAVLGKGPDEYQLIAGIKHHFSERAILQSL